LGVAIAFVCGDVVLVRNISASTDANQNYHLGYISL